METTIMAEDTFVVLDLDDLLDLDEELDEEVLASTIEYRTVPTGTYTLYGSEYEVRRNNDDAEYDPGRTEFALTFVDEDNKKFYCRVSHEKPVGINPYTGEQSDKKLQLWGQLVRAMSMSKASIREILTVFADGMAFNVDIDEYIQELVVADVINPDHIKYYQKQEKDGDDKVYYTIKKGDDASRTHLAAQGYTLKNKVKRIKAY
jgi:hypothetical protein